ncbi:MAG: hypothetical protein LM558_04195, partial [Thermosphaera sp.]|nr:hypothetical protein [Thermosphaera sp.]
ASGIEFNTATVTAPGELLGSLQVVLVPLNVSSPGVATESNTYVVSQGVPRISYLFSRSPPLVAFVEPSMYSGSYEVWYGGGNPYSQLIGSPGSSTSFWLAYDDFDYPTGFWVNESVSITGSRAYISPGGYLALQASYSSKTVHLWLLHGRRALVIIFQQAYSEFVALTLTVSNFTDIGLVQDGSDVYFVDPLGNCLYYNVLYLDKSAGILQVTVNPANNTAIYMLYGGVNACSAYRVS